MHKVSGFYRMRLRQCIGLKKRLNKVMLLLSITWEYAIKTVSE